MLLKSIKLNNFLSYGNDSEEIPMGKLNVIIGPNGSGKTNLLEAIEILRCAPNNIQLPFRDGGSIADWIWKGPEATKIAQIQATFEIPSIGTRKMSLVYQLEFTERNQHFIIHNEEISRKHPTSSKIKSLVCYNLREKIKKEPMGNNSLKGAEFDYEQSIFSQLEHLGKGSPSSFKYLMKSLTNQLPQLRLYREWGFGRYTSSRQPQKADLPHDMLGPSINNLGLVLNYLREFPTAKKKLLKALKNLYHGIDDYNVRIIGGTVQVLLHEGNNIIPATRLSDGTLRYLSLLAILCHPKPPPLVCIEEPELGLHPDVIYVLADLLKEASENCQLIVTTHSDILVDAMTDRPESLLVAEKSEKGTHMKRLDAREMEPWLEKYRLGELWTDGQIGGNRW